MNQTSEIEQLDTQISQDPSTTVRSDPATVRLACKFFGTLFHRNNFESRAQIISVVMHRLLYSFTD